MNKTVWPESSVNADVSTSVVLKLHVHITALAINTHAEDSISGWQGYTAITLLTKSSPCLTSVTP